MRRLVPALLVCLLVGCSGTVETSDRSSTRTPASQVSEPPPGNPPPDATERAQVVGIVDGDTIKVRLDGTVLSLRYIGIDTPELGQDGADSATRANARLVANQAVRLERDVSETDRFGRLLRYVWVRQGGRWLMVNRELVRLGMAESKAYPPDTMYQDELDRAERIARAAERGIWAGGGGIVPLVPPGGTPKPGSKCDAAYPGVCIPPPPPDLDCADVPYTNFRVLAPDPHHFDAEGDGRGCEGPP